MATSDHTLYTDADANKPQCILDNNGQVVLSLCKRCGRGESELDEPCLLTDEFYVFGEDLAPGMVGPFRTRDLADAHIEFMRLRGDASVCFHNNTRVVTTGQVKADKSLLWAFENNLVTPERDREFGLD